MKNIIKFQSIENEIDKDWSKMTWTRKKELLKEIKKIRIIKPSFYYILTAITILLFCFAVYVLNSNFNSYKIGIKDLSSLSKLVILALFFSFFAIFFVLLFIFLNKAKFFQDRYGKRFKGIENKLFESITEEEGQFYEKLDANSDSFSNQIQQNLTRWHFLPKDMSLLFAKDLKNFLEKYRFEDNDPLKKEQDESHAAIRYANSKN